MRTTLTLDDDVAAMLRRMQRLRKVKLKELVNTALREGLQSLDAPLRRRRQTFTQPVDSGPCRIGNVDNVGQALEQAEGPWHR